MIGIECPVCGHSERSRLNALAHLCAEHPNIVTLPSVAPDLAFVQHLDPKKDVTNKCAISEHQAVRCCCGIICVASHFYEHNHLLGDSLLVHLSRYVMSTHLFIDQSSEWTA